MTEFSSVKGINHHNEVCIFITGGKTLEGAINKELFYITLGVVDKFAVLTRIDAPGILNRIDVQELPNT